MKNQGLLIAILIFLVLSLGGYLVYDKIIKKEEKEEIEEKEEVEETSLKEDETKAWIYDANYEYEVSAKSYSTFFETYYASEIVVPYLNIDSADARNANRKIKEIFDEAMMFYEYGVEDNITYVDDCSYDYYLDDKTLSVVITFGVGATHVVAPKYYTYNFDLTTGNLLSYQDVYQLSGFNNITTKAEAAITEYMAETLTDFGYLEDDEFNTYNDQSIDNYKASVREETIKYFLDKDKKLNVVVKIVIPAGEGEFDRIIQIN